MHRRTVLGSVGAVGIASLSGCLGLAGLDQHESTPAGVDPAALEETGYDQTAVEAIRIDEDVDLMLYTETVSVTNYLTEHEKAVDLGPLGEQRAAVFMVLTTPQVSVAGQEFNPVEDMSSDELVELVADNYDDISNLSHEGEGTLDVLEQATTQAQYRADATFEGQDLEVYLHITEAVQTDDDHLVAIGVYPVETEIEERENVEQLFEHIIEEAAEENGGSNGEADDDGDDDGEGEDDESDDNGGEDGDDSDDGDDDSALPGL